VPSPDGRREVVAYYRNCGASSRGSIHLSILDTGAPVPQGRGNVLVFSDTTSPSQSQSTTISWASPDSILIGYGVQAHVHSYATRVHGIGIALSPGLTPGATLHQLW
jgi:hypothetical protein